MKFIDYQHISLNDSDKIFKRMDKHPELFPPCVNKQYLAKLRNGKYAIVEWRVVGYDTRRNNRELYQFVPFPYSEAAGDQQIVAWSEIE